MPETIMYLNYTTIKKFNWEKHYNDPLMRIMGRLLL